MALAFSLFGWKFVCLNVLDENTQTLGHPFVLVIYQLLPYIRFEVGYIEIAELARFYHRCCYEVRQV